MAIDPNEFEDIKKKFLETCKMAGLNDGQIHELVGSEFASAIIAYIQRQVSAEARLAGINEQQFAFMLKSAEIGLFELIYVTYYPHDVELYDRDPVYISSRNLLRLLYNRARQNKDEGLARLEMETRRPIMPGIGGMVK